MEFEDYQVATNFLSSLLLQFYTHLTARNSPAVRLKPWQDQHQRNRLL